MSSNKREREIARRRYEDWQQRIAAKSARRRRLQFIGGAALAGLVVIALVFGLVGAFRPQTDPAAQNATSQPGPVKDPGNPCPTPTQTPKAPPTTGTVPPADAAQNRTWTGSIETTCGPIGIDLDGAAAPQSVANFVTLAQAGFFDDTICHRLTTEGIHVLQCGDPSATGTGGPGYTYGPVENAPEGDVYPAGTIAMARQPGKADSQGSQFFIVYQDSTIPSDDAGGYSVLGRVTSGLDVVTKVAEGGTDPSGVAPARAIAIEKVEVS